MLALSACGTTPKKLERSSVPPPDQRPVDLALAATVFAPRVPLPDVELPRAIRPARYIVEADGVLRASVGAASDAAAFPPRVRQLSPRQADQVWRALLDSGLLDDANPNRLSDPESAMRSGDRTTAMIFVSYQGKRTTLRVLLDRATPDAVAAERVIDRLAELAWLPQ
jgi:hypothetical protein